MPLIKPWPKFSPLEYVLTDSVPRFALDAMLDPDTLTSFGAQRSGDMEKVCGVSDVIYDSYNIEGCINNHSYYFSVYSRF